jgi:hypothetical protein
MTSTTPARLLQRDEPNGFVECARFDVRSVTGAHYTLIELARRGERGPGGGERRYRTAYAGLPVAANDDGSFTIVETHTRLLRLDHD